MNLEALTSATTSFDGIFTPGAVGSELPATEVVAVAPPTVVVPEVILSPASAPALAGPIVGRLNCGSSSTTRWSYQSI